MLPLLRQTLDLFAHPAAASVQAAGQQPRAPFEPGTLLRDAIDPAHFRHPRANRESRIGDAVVGYAFTRARRRTIGFAVGPDGLVVRAPRWTPLHEVESALQEKGRWILDKLHESRQRQQLLESARIVWCNGTKVPYLGGNLELVLDPAHHFRGQGAGLRRTQTPVDLDAPAHQLFVGLGQTATPEQMRDVVQAWLMRQAQDNFLQRMAHFAPLLGVQWTQLRLSNAGTRWGSASTTGAVRLNWRLIHFSQSVIDYVVAHELSHLRVMDHSPRFWDTVASVVPDYASLRRQLRQSGMPRW